VKHHLKTWTKYFDAVKHGVKPFEVRMADRPFAVGDTLVLEEWDPEERSYTGHSVEARVTYLLPGGSFGVAEGYCVMGVTQPLETGVVVVTIPIETAKEFIGNGPASHYAAEQWLQMQVRQSIFRLQQNGGGDHD
jgi:hypothetical protein